MTPFRPPGSAEPSGSPDPRRPRGWCRPRGLTKGSGFLYYTFRRELILRDKKSRSHDSFFVGMVESDRYRKDLEELLSGAGLGLVDLSVSRHRGSVQVRAVIYAPGGTGIDECSRAHRLIQPRLQVLLSEQDFHLEVASPGVDRWIRSDREYAIFTGRGIRILLKEGDEWLAGRIAQAGPSAMTIRGAWGERTVEYASIAKARLDYAQEGA